MPYRTAHRPAPRRELPTTTRNRRPFLKRTPPQPPHWGSIVGLAGAVFAFSSMIFVTVDVGIEAAGGVRAIAACALSLLVGDEQPAVPPVIKARPDYGGDLGITEGVQ